jgi:hypothetical protein
VFALRQKEMALMLSDATAGECEGYFFLYQNEHWATLCLIGGEEFLCF